MSHLGIAMQELCSPALDGPGAGGGLQGAPRPRRLQSLCLLGPTRCRKGQDVLTSSTKGVLEDGNLPSLERGLCVHACVTETQ